MLNQFKLWWSGLQDRERWVLMIGGFFLTMFVLYSAIVGPLLSTVSDYRRQVTNARTLLAFMQKTSEKIMTLQAQGIHISTAPVSSNLLTLVEQSATQHQLSVYLKEVKQVDHTQVSLTFEKVPFDACMRWLQLLLTNDGVKMVSFTATRLPTLGTAQVQVTLSK
jgi:general secretion pathway protein M